MVSRPEGSKSTPDATTEPAETGRASGMVLRRTFTGMCDASAAVVLDESRFLLFDDEKKNPHVFDIGASAPIDAIRLKDELDPAGDAEFDCEGAARIGDAIVGITSHGRKKGRDDDPAGAAAPERRRLFAFTVKRKDGHYELGRFIGYRKTLLKDFTQAFGRSDYDLLEAARHMPETPEGLNIEGMAAWRDQGVIIGLRGPLFDGRALMIPIVNALDYVAGADPRFEPPIPIALDGRGIRDIERMDDRYLIIGGPSPSSETFALYAWSGDPDDREGRKLADLAAPGAKPEVVLSMDGGRTISVLSDDGDYIAALRASRGDPEIMRQFRMFDVPLGG